ncbi:MAG TPA: hypothetical protein VD738_04700 [Nitrospira sp.]|nr:hypothetical protein [Nitrospira sp.]
MHLCALLALILLVSPAPGQGADSDAFPDIEKHSVADLQEATRVLEEEVKLAGRSQAYLRVDLVARAIEIKARGVTLHRLPLSEWTASAIEQMGKTFRLNVRPAVVRRKIDPSSTAEQEPIALTDMPTQYTLSFTPALRVEIGPDSQDGALRWARWYGARWWRKLEWWAGSIVSWQPAPIEPSLELILSVEQAQSLAWSLVDGMALVVRRPTDK